MRTHEDWERARESRNWAAVRITRAILAGNTASAKDLADFAINDEAMESIATELREAVE